MELTLNEKKDLIQDLLIELDGKMDGSRKNILVPECPFCHHDGYKFGIYVGNVSSKSKRFGSSHCFHCGRSFIGLKNTLEAIGLKEYIPKETTDLEEELPVLNLFDDEEIDDKLIKIEMPNGYKRTYKNAYLKSRGMTVDDFLYFPCGTTRGMNREFEEYVLMEIHDRKRLVGYVARKIWSKEEIDDFNDTHRYKVRRYNNSQENQFSKMLYNFDSIVEGETDTVILCEGPFDVIGLVRKMDLYDYKRIVPVATFGKKISDCQMMKLQSKGVETVVIGYDNDDAAKESIGKVAAVLCNYFDVFCLQYPSWVDKDFGDMKMADVYDVFANHIVTPREFNLNLSL